MSSNFEGDKDSFSITLVSSASMNIFIDNSLGSFPNLQVASPLARKFIVPATKRLGKELLVQAAPELIDIATRKKTLKQALKNTVKNTIKKQIGAGRSKCRMSRKRKKATTTTTTRKRKTKVLIPKKRNPLRSRSNFFTKVRNDY